jgi:Bacterial protein of unknown function (DUF899)
MNVGRPTWAQRPDWKVDTAMNTMNAPAIVTPEEWEAARQRLPVKEKALTRARDVMAAERRRMPWVAVKTPYEFDGPSGRMLLVDLFEGRRQLLLYGAFFGPGVHGWPDHACVGCSLMADQVAHLAHLHARDITFAFASRTPQPDIERVSVCRGHFDRPTSRAPCRCCPTHKRLRLTRSASVYASQISAQSMWSRHCWPMCRGIRLCSDPVGLPIRRRSVPVTGLAVAVEPLAPAPRTPVRGVLAVS